MLVLDAIEQFVDVDAPDLDERPIGPMGIDIHAQVTLDLTLGSAAGP